ncbi:hypothetical protein WJX84_007513 [Apatococcus fuscideae]|uniref:Cystinosin n=1 Tax=Apatococcus fuscideae TaxID=2026836 RepID=A0AAW1RRW6_9CHLO
MEPVSSRALLFVRDHILMIATVVIGLSLGFGLPAEGDLPTPWNRISSVMGWIYFAAWSASFYPQVFHNFRRKTVEGFSFDFAILNPVGFLAYTTFNAAMLYSGSIRQAYRDHYHSRPAVHANDLIFAAHAFILSSITLTQCGFYSKCNPWTRASQPCRIFLWAAAISTAAFTLGILAGMWQSALSWLTFLYFLSYIKLAITLAKYAPQVALNYRHKSTQGFSIGTALYDFTGGLLSIAQQILDGILMQDFSAITGSPVKFGLGMISLVYDVIFMVQHYLLYPSHKSGEQPPGDNAQPGRDARAAEDRERLLAQA